MKQYGKCCAFMTDHYLSMKLLPMPDASKSEETRMAGLQANLPAKFRNFPNIKAANNLLTYGQDNPGYEDNNQATAGAHEVHLMRPFLSRRPAPGRH